MKQITFNGARLRMDGANYLFTNFLEKSYFEI